MTTDHPRFHRNASVTGTDGTSAMPEGNSGRTSGERPNIDSVNNCGSKVGGGCGGGGDSSADGERRHVYSGDTGDANAKRKAGGSPPSMASSDSFCSSNISSLGDAARAGFPMSELLTNGDGMYSEEDSWSTGPGGKQGSVRTLDHASDTMPL